jgi:predicted ATP-grasp superfamily ATP-dependent carboligase
MLIRALTRNGLRALAVEADRSLPGNATREAPIHFVDDINGPRLVDALLALPEQYFGARAPALILTNDRMVRVVGEQANRLIPRFRLSWAHCSTHVLRLLQKSEIEAQCRATGLNYPRTVNIDREGLLDGLDAKLGFPVIVKPVAPVSEFKTLVFDRASDVRAEAARIRACLPVIAQEFIPGGDEVIHFAAAYFRNGVMVARFEGVKIRSRPMGHTTIAACSPNDEVHALMTRFFDGLQLSGPASLELKRGPDGRYWVIEPTVGRTDYWVGLCIANGVNIPMLEVLDQPGPHEQAARQTTGGLWINGERDPFALAWLAMTHPGRLIGSRVSGVFLDRQDPAPGWRLTRRHAAHYLSRALNRLRKLFGGDSMPGRA